MPLIRNKKGNSVTTAENNTRETNVQPTVHHVENAAKLIIGNLSPGPANGNNLTKEKSWPSKKVIHKIEDRGDEDDDEILTISTIKVNTIEDTRHSIHDTCDEAFTTLEITQPEKKRKINIQWNVDTGAQSNVLPIRLLRKIAPEKFDDEGNPKPEALGKNEAVLSAYGGSIIKKLSIFYITDTSGPAILGLKACTALKQVSLHCTLRTNQLDQADPTNSFNASAQNSGTCKKRSNYIGSHVPLEERPSITSKQELMEMYPECFNGTVGCF